VRTSLPAETRARFAEFLERSLARGERDLEGIGRAYARATAGTLGDAAELARYLSRFTYRLGAAEEEGLDAFRSLLAELAPQAAEP
jgi:predicted solute-binding protein